MGLPSLASRLRPLLPPPRWHFVGPETTGNAGYANSRPDTGNPCTDGVPGSLRTLAGEYEHPDASLIFGKLNGATYGLLIDEVRYSSGVLTPDQFLQARAPEPSTLILLAVGAACVAAAGRRRRRK